MILQDLLDRITNGSVHILLWDYNSGVVYLSTIWQNDISEEFRKREVAQICIREYEMRLGLK